MARELLKRDVVFIGGGPAAMQAGIYLASEGIRTVVIEKNKIGGQIRQTPRVDNLFGLPGISGIDLADRLERQYLSFNKLGSDETNDLASIYYGDVEGVWQAGEPGADDEYMIEGYSYRYANRFYLRTRCVVVSSGVSWDIQSVEEKVATFIENGRLLLGPEATTHPDFKVGRHNVVVIGGGNSAGQGILELVQNNPHMTVNVVCRSGIKMSDYLGRQLTNHPNVHVHHGEVDYVIPSVNAPGYTMYINQGHQNIQVQRISYCIYAGSSRPNTDFLNNFSVLDFDGFVKTGEDESLLTQTEFPGLFAIGDVVSGNPKRCMRAVGDGAQVATDIHRYINTNAHPQSTTS